MLIIFMGGGSLYSKVNDEMKDYSEKSETDNQDYFFKMSDADIEKFIEKVKILKKGMDIQEVINILGEPYYNRRIGSKKWIEPSRGRCLTYYLKKFKKGVVYEGKDSKVLLYFDVNNKLEDYTIDLR